MTKAHSEVDDNGGRCESCNKPETRYQSQQTYPVKLGGGLGTGTMWLCPICLAEHQKRDAPKVTTNWTMEEVVPVCWGDERTMVTIAPVKLADGSCAEKCLKGSWRGLQLFKQGRRMDEEVWWSARILLVTQVVGTFDDWVMSANAPTPQRAIDELRQQLFQHLQTVQRAWQLGEPGD